MRLTYICILSQLQTLLPPVVTMNQPVNALLLHYSTATAEAARPQYGVCPKELAHVRIPATRGYRHVHHYALRFNLFPPSQ